MPDIKTTMKELEESEYNFEHEFSFTDEELEEIEGWKVGEKYHFVIQAKQVGMHMEGGKRRARFRIKKVAVIDVEETKYDEMQRINKELNDTDDA